MNKTRACIIAGVLGVSILTSAAAMAWSTYPATICRPEDETVSHSYTAVSLSRTRDAGPPASSRSHGSLPCGSD